MKFYHDSLKDGSLAFTRKTPRNSAGADFEFMFTSPPSYRAISHDTGEVQMTMRRTRTAPVSPLWTPANLGAPLVDYWDAGVGLVLDGPKVITWTGQGPNATTLSRNIISGTLPLSPMWDATSFAGRPGISFGRDNYLNPHFLSTGVGAVAFGTSTASFFMSGTVAAESDAFARWVSFSNDTTDFSSANAVVAISRSAGGQALRWEQNGGNGGSYNITYDKPSRFGVTFNGSAAQTYLNDVFQVNTSVSFTLAATGRLVIGYGFNAGPGMMDGIIHRLVITKDALSVANRANVDFWLQRG
jgi:hypothetical protein